MKTSILALVLGLVFTPTISGSAQGASLVGLGILGASSNYSYPADVSDGGSVVVGRANSVSGEEAFRWTEESGMVGLGDLEGGGFDSLANDVSGDGSVVVGFGTSASGSEATIWDAAHGMRELDVVLTLLGVDVTGWSLDAAAAISSDGRTIVGSGTNPLGQTEGWIAVIPEP